MLLTIIVFILILGVIIFVHELGHFYTARKLGIGVEEFGFGYPPRLFGIKKKGVLYSLNLIPLGGFVKIKGESGDHSQDSDSFSNQPVWKRAIVLSAGVIMNWILAFVLLSIGFIAGFPAMIEGEVEGAIIKNQEVQIIEVYPGSVAETGGLKVGDVILTVDDQQFIQVAEMQSYIKDHNQQALDFSIQRGSQQLELNLTPAVLAGQGEDKLIGIGFVQVGQVAYPWYQAWWQGLKTTAIFTYRIVEALIDIIVGLFRGGDAGEVSGPIGVAVFAARAVGRGWIYVLQFAAILCINLAIINILPFPALDGGRILFLIIEKIRRRPNDQKVEAIVHNLGFALLMVIAALITYRDVLRYGSGILDQIKGLF